MLSFSQGICQSTKDSAQTHQDEIFLSTCHVRVATACFLLSSWVIWSATVAALMLSYDIWSMESCWTKIHCSAFSVLIALHGLILVLGTVGWLCNWPKFCSLMVVPPMSYCGAISGIVINYWISDGELSLEYYLTSPTTLGFLSVLVLAVYAAMVITRYCEYVNRLQLLKRRTGFIDVFKDRVFGTPPLKEFNRMEFARCADLSDSHIDDIFGDYEPNVALY